ncbi:MAG: TspO/MBR family protein [Candidatus Micrarchaeota archaeon]
MTNWLKLVGVIVLCELAGVVGSVFTMPAITTWYAGLAKPFFTPPSWVFAPVWIALYALMGIALYLVLESPKPRKNRALLFFGVQLVFNTLWSIVFFGLQNLFAGLVAIVLLWIAIAGSMYYFQRIDKRAAWLLAPYLLWVTFAALLNYSIWMLN